MANFLQKVLSDVEKLWVDIGDDAYADVSGSILIDPATKTPLTILPISDASIGATTDTPLAGETAEGATARTGISLWKRAVNKLIEIKALLTHPATFYFGRKTIATAGTEEAIATTQALAAGIIYIKALPTNTGYVYVGKDPVTSSTGYPLLAGEEIVILTDNLLDVFVDVSVNGEGVAYLGS